MVYLDNAATSFPKPAGVVEAVRDFMLYAGANPGRSGHRLALAAGRTVDKARRSLAQLLQVEDEADLFFGLNCTDMLNTAIQGIVERGGRIRRLMPRECLRLQGFEEEQIDKILA